jgi:hypothetical protein
MPSTRTQRAVAVLAALTISASVGGCASNDDGNGGSNGADTSVQDPLSKEAYLKQVNAAQTAFANDAAKLNLANPSSPKEFGNSLSGLNRLIDTLRRRLDDIVPPDAVTTEQDALVQQLTAYGDAIKQQKGALTSDNAQKAATAAQKVGKASTDFSQQFDATINRINDNLGLETSTTPSN